MGKITATCKSCGVLYVTKLNMYFLISQFLEKSIGTSLWLIKENGNWVRVDLRLQSEITEAFERYKKEAKCDPSRTTIHTSAGPLIFGTQNFRLRKDVYLGKKKLKRKVMFFCSLDDILFEIFSKNSHS